LSLRIAGRYGTASRKPYGLRRTPVNVQAFRVAPIDDFTFAVRTDDAAEIPNVRQEAIAFWTADLDGLRHRAA
jgi:hypothetical protein